MQGIFARISGLIFGRARDYSNEEKIQLEQKIVDIVAGEFGRKDLPVVANVDFGHTDPQLILPIGVLAELDFTRKDFRLIERWLQ